MKLFRYFRIPATRRRLLLAAAFYSGIYRFRILHRPFSETAAKLGVFRYETPTEAIDAPVLRDVRWAVDAMQYHVVWKSQCLDRALAAKKLLNRRKLPCTLYLGVRPDEQGSMTAHAWLRCGSFYVSGGDGSGYAVTGIYGDRDLLQQKQP